MPLEPRSPDTFTIDSFLLGFSQVEFRPRLSDGTLGTPVALGILASEELQKEVETLEMEDGSPGTATTALELVSKFKPSFELGLFNFRADLAQYIFGASTITAQVADAAAVVTDEPFTLASGAQAESTFVPLANGDINDASFTGTSLTCAPRVDEVVGAGTGTTGSTSGDFALDYKPLVIGDVTACTVAGVAFTPIAVGAAAAGNEVEVVVGTGATSGDMQFFVGGVAANVTGTILASYAPSHAFANLTDYVTDPLLGRIRFLNIDGATDALKSGQPMLADYTYNRKAGYTMQPFTQGGGAFNGSATVKHLPDVGSNFIWEMPSVTIRIDDNALTFGSDDFVQGTLVLNVNDAGGTDRFGTLQLASQTEANA
ncbi:MAG: hypothetical protein WBG86_06255 [Polyangiales bacterium]